MKIDLSGKTAIVTGSTEGIGFAIVKGLAEAGATTVVNGRTAAKVEAAVSRLNGKARGVVATWVPRRATPPSSPPNRTPMW